MIEWVVLSADGAPVDTITAGDRMAAIRLARVMYGEDVTVQSRASWLVDQAKAQARARRYR